MQKPTFTFLFLALFQLGFGQGGPDYTPLFRASDDIPFDIPDGQEYVFGYLEVPENRADPESRTIELPVFIFKSRNADPQPDPVIYTVGGPGNSTLPSAPYMNYYRYLDDRDLILFEQRGTQYARPHLDCPEWARAVHLAGMPDTGKDARDSLFEKAARECRERLAGQDIDLNSYRTREIAADIADLRRALGFDQYNLLTISYSTKIAQVLLRDHPDGIRSVVMDSPLPLEVNYDEESVANLFAAMDKLFSDCEADPDCKKAHPELRERYLAFLRDKTKNPLEITVENPATGEPVSFELKGKDLLSAFTEASTGDVPAIPHEMEKLLRGDPSTIEPELASRFEGPGSGAGMGMRLSVWCAEEFPFSDQKTIAEETTRYPEAEGLSPAVFDRSICEIWNVRPEKPSENKPVKSNVPVLLISGGYDNETPPKWAANMRANLPNSFHLVFEGWKHTPTTNWGDPCAMEAARAFFNDPEAMPGPDCLGKVSTPGFVTE